VGFQPNDPGDHQIDGPGIQIPAAAPELPHTQKIFTSSFRHGGNARYHSVEPLVEGCEPLRLIFTLAATLHQPMRSFSTLLYDEASVESP